MGERRTLENVTLNWPKLFSPQANKNFPNNPPTYSVCVILKPGVNDADIKWIDDTIKAVGQEVFKGKGYQTPKSWEPKENGEYHLNVSANEAWNRQVVGRDLKPIIDQNEIYSGVVANVAIDVFASEQYKRVCTGLLAVQKVADGERMDNAPTADELFAPIKVKGGAPDPLA